MVTLSGVHGDLSGFLGDSYGLRMVFPRFSYGFPMVISSRTALQLAQFGANPQGTDVQFHYKVVPPK